MVSSLLTTQGKWAWIRIEFLQLPAFLAARVDDMALTAHNTEKEIIIRISWTFKQFHLYVFREVFDNISADDIFDFSTKCQKNLAVVKRNWAEKI